MYIKVRVLCSLFDRVRIVFKLLVSYPKLQYPNTDTFLLEMSRDIAQSFSDISYYTFCK